MGTGSFPGVKCGRGMLLTTQPLLVPHGRVELYLYPPSGPHRVCNGITLPFFLINCVEWTYIDCVGNYNETQATKDTNRRVVTCFKIPSDIVLEGTEYNCEIHSFMHTLLRFLLYWDVPQVDWKLRTDVSGQHTGPTLKCQAGFPQRR